MPGGAHVHFRDVLSGQWRLGAASFAQHDSHSLTSSMADELGPAEALPKGFLRRAGFHSRILWRRIVANTRAEWPLAKPRLWVIIPCLIFQYVHAIFTGMAYYMHTPLPVDDTTLHDLGFEALPYLGINAVSEIMVYVGFALFFAWALSPFVLRRKHFHFVVLLKRVLVILVTCQVLRILSFLSTQLPAPAPHCRAPEPTSNVPWPVWWQVIFVNVARQASKGCGDLVFSSHVTFLLVFCWTYAVMGRYLLMKAFWFCYVAATALCIIASRKHYTVDITIAAYVVPLVFFHFCRKWTTTRDDMCTNDGRGIVPLGPALPVTALPSSGGGGAPKFGGGGVGSRRGSASGSRRDSANDGGASAAAGAAGGDIELGGGGYGNGGYGDSAVLELSAARTSSAPLGLEGGERSPRPQSPQKGMLASARDALADLPRRAMGSGGPAPAHRRTESSEPVLLAEDLSASSLGGHYH